MPTSTVTKAGGTASDVARGLELLREVGALVRVAGRFWVVPGEPMLRAKLGPVRGPDRFVHDPIVRALIQDGTAAPDGERRVNLTTSLRADPVESQKPNVYSDA